MARVFQVIQSNPFFKFLSSVKMAIPLLLIVLIACAIGTIYESRYNAQVASLIIYKSWWFQGLLGFLWINILCAALSRIPWKKHHIGFVTTHLGLLLLLAGSLITKNFGVDGSLQVQIDKASSKVFLPQLMLEVTSVGKGTKTRKIFTRKLESFYINDLDFLNLGPGYHFKVVEYHPFTKQNQIMAAENGKTLRFNLKSEFFNVDESLNFVDRPSMQMGPVQIQMVETRPSFSMAKKRNKKSKKNSNAPVLIIKDFATGDPLKTIPINSLVGSGLAVQGSTIKISKIYQQALIVENKIQEGGQKGVNPALELQITHQGQTLREIVYEKFPQFSLNQDGNFGLKFEYQSNGSQDIPRPSTPMGNAMYFVINADESVDLILAKNGELVQEGRLSIDQAVETPWMGMKITLKALGQSTQMHKSSNEVQPIPMPFRSDLPPSAIKIRIDGKHAPGEGIWLVENSEQTITDGKNKYHLYYGSYNIDLPFNIHLDKFTKEDYYNTTMAKSYESDVRINGHGPSINISMNEPLKHKGFTLYQSSYIMQPGYPVTSIFSVNQDPGRFWKYIGSIILSIGIILYTLMKSQWYANRQKKGKND